MKKILILLTCIIFFNCSKDEDKSNCYIIVKKEMIKSKYYFNEREVKQEDYEKYKLGQEYCFSGRPLY